MRSLSVLFLAITLSGCDQRREEASESTVPSGAGDSQEDALNGGLDDYEKSLTRLTHYCDSWTADYVPITANELKEQEPWVSDVHDIFEDFWTPASPDRFVGDDDQVSLRNPYWEAPFLVLQPSVEVSLIETSDGDAESATEKTIAFALKLNQLAGEDLESFVVEDFRPRVSFEERKIVRLTEERQRTLLAFLGDEHYPLGSGNLMSPATAKGNSKSRARYLSHSLMIIHGHFSGWHIVSHPKVRRILLNTARTEAHVDFQFIDKGGTAFYLKQDGEWTMVDSELTWVQ